MHATSVIVTTSSVSVTSFFCIAVEFVYAVVVFVGICVVQLVEFLDAVLVHFWV